MPQGGNAGQHSYQNPQYGMPQGSYAGPHGYGYQSAPYDASHGSPSRPGFLYRVAAKTGSIVGSRKVNVAKSYVKVGLAKVVSPVTDRMSAETKAHLREGMKGIKNDVIGSSSHLTNIQQSYISGKRGKREQYEPRNGGE
jgi:hypothetical protein